MQCSHCGKNDWVTIGNQAYCTHCGNAQASSAESTPVQAAAATPATKTVSDVRSVRPTNPASAMHGGPASSSPAVLDLRTVVKPTPQATTAAPVAAPAEPEPTPQPTQEPAVKAEVAAQPTIAPTTPAETAKDAKIARAAEVAKSSMIKRFVKPGAQTATPSVPVTPPTVIAPVTPPQPVVAESAPVAPSELPAITETQHQGLANHLQNDQPTDHHKPSPKAVLAATMAIAIMGVYIWVNNVGNLTITAAAQKAGINATLPSYMPSSYSLSGPVSYGPGYLTMQFKSPSNAGPLVITERRTDWSAASLLELYVSPKSQNYVTVQTQGLTIYVYNGNQATWVNRGIQYVVEGDTHLSKDQIVKIAESL